MIALVVIGLVGLGIGVGMLVDDLLTTRYRQCAECGKVLRLEQDCCDTQEN